MGLAVRGAVGGALWGLAAGDALSMPVHWYYDVRHIHRDFEGWISGLRAPRGRHPSSILALSNPAGSGRSSWSPARGGPDVVGTVILHDKLAFWRKGGGVHYHQGMAAGDNTLNALCALRAALVLAQGPDPPGAPGARGAVLADYVAFLTAPRTHNDTYAESFHRSFFSDWRGPRPTAPDQVLEFAEQRSEKLIGSSPDSQLDAIGCLPMVIPFVLLSASANEDQAVAAAVAMVRLTHPHPGVPRYVELYARALHATLHGASLQQAARRALGGPLLDAWGACGPYSRQAAGLAPEERLGVHQKAVDTLGMACYTKGAISSLFYLAHEFHGDFEGGVLANTNCGGENCNRGAALGALLGARAAYCGGPLPQAWRDGLPHALDYIPRIQEAWGAGGP
ncbi:unnamed protein product [Arctogadus glacialis]